MKFYALFIFLLAGAAKLDAQNIFGIAYYNTPKGWKAVQESPNIVLEEQRVDGKSCRIIISATEDVAINLEDAYLTYRQQKSNDNSSSKNYSKVVRKENPYIIAFYSQSLETKGTKQKNSFYSFTNGKESFYVQYISDDINCDAVFRTFLNTLEIAEATVEVADKSKFKTKAKVGGKPRGRPRKNPV